VSSREAVRAAIDFCREHGADLRLVGVVEDKLTDSTRSGAGERARRYKAVGLALKQAAETAAATGVVATTAVRVGDPTRELLREAEAVGSGDLFFVRARGRIRATLSRKPRSELAHVSLASFMAAELAKAA
jgi:nucleotide-binding universal stress UspA family protein